MRASAWAPEGFGVPAQPAPRPYALRAEKEPQRTQNNTCTWPLVCASMCPLAVILSTANEVFGPLHL